MVTMRRYSVAANSSTPTIRVVVLGGRNVGKSALVVRYLTKRFIGEYVSGTEITYQQEVNLSGNKVTAEICDALINKETRNCLKKLSANTEAYLLVYNVCCRDSFEYACQLARDVKAGHLNSPSKNDVPLLLVGNKSDLNHFREVETREGEEFARTMSLCHFTETSAAESYPEVERAFQIVFRLVRSRSISSSLSSVSSSRLIRKNSFSQVANLIRDHCRKQHPASSHIAKANSLDRGMSLARSYSMNFDNNNNSTAYDQSTKRRTRKKGLTNFYHDNGKSSCSPLCTLSECPIKEEMKKDLDGIDTDRPILRLQRYNTYNGDMSKYSSNAICIPNDPYSRSSPPAVMKMSISSDEAADFSDVSMLEEDAFLPERNTSSKSFGSQMDFTSEETKVIRPTSLDVQDGSNFPVRKTSINKKNLKIFVHSDGEFDDKNLKNFGEIPPKSAPVLHSPSSNKFRYFPNGIPECQVCRKSSWSSVSSSSVPISPLLENGAYPHRVKSPKEEKKSPSHSSLFKQFFKGTINGASSINRYFGSSLSLNSQVSPASSETSLSSVVEYPRSSLSAIDERKCQDEVTREQICVHGSSNSLSSIVSNDVEDAEEANFSCSAPTSPRVQINATPRLKTRRPSFREAVSLLIRKRKQASTNDCFKHSKERFL